MVEIRGIYDDFGEPDYELSNQAYQVAESTGIHILRDKEPVVVAIDEGRVVGALFTSLVGDSFSFDVAVLAEYQGQGVGRQLIDAGMQEYRNLKFDMPEVEMNLDVVNPMLQDVLRRRGLEIKKRVNDNRVIMGSWLLKVWRK